MAGKRIIIIGAGLGGLICGKILSQSGFQVTILEQGVQAGGALQSFEREGIRFDTGFHSVGGLNPGEDLYTIFNSIGLGGLPWMKMDADEIIGGELPFLRLSSAWEEERQHVLNPYRKDVWRLKGGGRTLVDALSRGQEILLCKKVVEIEKCSAGCADGSRHDADIVVSDIHPALTFKMLRDPVRPSYLKRIMRMTNGPGVFTVNAKLRPGTVRYLNHSIFIDNKVMIHFGEPDENGFAPSLDLLSFVTRSDDFSDRRAFAESMILTAAKRLDNIQDSIEKYWTSTPLTWERYTGTPGGSAYGIIKHEREDYLSPQTPVPWLFLTGQNIGLHGVLGTAVSALGTCNTIKNLL